MPHKDPAALAAYRKKLLARPGQREKARRRARKWYAKNKKKALAYQKAYRERNLAAYRAAALESTRKSLYPRPTRPEPKTCEACDMPFDKAPRPGSCLDHDHNTNAFRGWLCHSCNIALGHLKDDRRRIQKLLDYLDFAEGMQ